MTSQKFDDFVNKVTSKVKAKETHTFIKKELSNHLQQLSQSFQKTETSKDEVEEKAVQEMGNPYTIGEHLNRLYRQKIDWLLIVLFLIIAGIGFLPVYGAVLSQFNQHYISFQAIAMIIACIIGITLQFFDYRKLKNLWILFYSSGLFLLIYTYLYGDIQHGLKRWVSIGAFGFNSTTVSLLLFFLAWGSILYKINEFKNWKKQILLLFLFWIPIMFYLILPHFMYIILYFLCVTLMFAFSQVQKKPALSFVITNGMIGLVFMITLFITSRGGHFYNNRLLPYINPNADPHGGGYIYLTAKDLLTRAGWFGNGFTDEYNLLLPGIHTDFAFIYLIHSLGWAFGVFLCFVVTVFIAKMISNTFKTKDLFGRLLVIGGSTLFAVPTYWNMLMGFGIVPIMGVSLPFISYGLNTTLFYAIVLGLILSVYRRKDIVNPTIADIKYRSDGAN